MSDEGSSSEQKVQRAADHDTLQDEHLNASTRISRISRTDDKAH